MYNHPSIRRNVISLFFLQGANYIFPLLTIPWLARVLGPDGFGRIGFATAFCLYFSLFSDYGFNLSATREIAIHRDSCEERSRIFWSTFFTKVILAFAGLLILLFLTFFVGRIAQERSLLITGYLMVAGSVLTPTWYFQGIERMSILTAANLFARCITLPLIFILIHGKDDVWLAMLISSSTCFVSGCLSMGVLVSLHHVKWFPPSLSDIRRSLIDGWHLFVSSAAVSLYTTTSTVALGFLCGNAAVGYFSAAQRLLRAIQAMLSPLTQAVYPRISHLMHHSRNDAFALIRKVMRIQGAVTFVASVVLLLGADIIIRLAFGPDYQAAVPAFRCLAPLPFLIGLSNVFGVQTMLPLGMKVVFSRILLASGILNLLMIVPLGLAFGATGAGASICITEFVVTVAMGLYVTRAVPVIWCAGATASE